MVAIACGYGIYLTHTRAAWLSGVVVLIIGALIARGYRKGFIVAICLVASMVAVNWSVFTSTDRKAGGVGSMNEVHDRLNANQTALWAFARKPVAGWGIGRFPTVNTYHHQQWSPDVPWIRGYGVVAHETELGILAELGVIGLALWICVLVLVIRRLWDCVPDAAGPTICAASRWRSLRSWRSPPSSAPGWPSTSDSSTFQCHYLFARRNHDRLVRSQQAVADGGGRP